MEERTFVIKEVFGRDSYCEQIPESEVSNRIMLIFDYMSNGGINIDRQIDILLYG